MSGKSTTVALAGRTHRSNHNQKVERQLAVNYITVRFVTEDPLNQRALNRIAKQVQDNMNLLVLDGQEIGLIKENDVSFELSAPQGHAHRSTRRSACEHCSLQAMDGVRDPNE